MGKSTLKGFLIETTKLSDSKWYFTITLDGKYITSSPDKYDSSRIAINAGRDYVLAVLLKGKNEDRY